MRDQALGKMIANGPKMGCLFTLQLSIISTISFAYIVAANNSNVWYKKLGHFNYTILTHLLKHDYLGNKDFNNLSPDCATCKLSKKQNFNFS